MAKRNILADKTAARRIKMVQWRPSLPEWFPLIQFAVAAILLIGLLWALFSGGGGGTATPAVPPAGNAVAGEVTTTTAGGSSTSSTPSTAKTLPGSSTTVPRADSNVPTTLLSVSTSSPQHAVPVAAVAAARALVEGQNPEGQITDTALGSEPTSTTEYTFAFRVTATGGSSRWVDITVAQQPSGAWAATA